MPRFTFASVAKRSFSSCHVLAAAGLLAVTTPVHAQDFPTKPVRIVVPFSAGGATDTLARALAEKMAADLGQPVIIDNKAGAAGNIGTDFVVKAAPDGHTLVLSLTGSLLTNRFLYTRLPYDPRKDLALLSVLAFAPVVLLVNPALPVHNAAELLQYIAANKGKLSYGSWGAGAFGHLAGNYLSDQLKADMTHIGYKGEAPMMQDLIGGQISMAYSSLTQAGQFIENGRVRAIGVTGDKRLAALPDVPTLAEQGLTDDVYRVVGWLAIAAPAKTPAPVLDRLARAVRAACQQPETRSRIGAMGFEPECGSRADFAKVVERDSPVWERLVRQSGATLD